MITGGPGKDTRISVVKQIWANLLALGRTRLAILGGVGALVVVVTILAASYLAQPDYRPLVSNLSSSEAAEIVNELEKSGYQPLISDDGSVISLPMRDIPRARMAIAAAGLPGSSVAGWEIFDTASGLGMTSFSQRMQRLRALEGELIRSIKTLAPVEDARVHIVLPERESFSQERPEASASVIVKTRRGLPLQRDHALAVRNLVANAIPDLAPERVIVVSANGETILGADGESPGAMASFARTQIEERIAANIESLITARVGAGNARVRVAAEISNERQVIVDQTYDPEQQVANRSASEEDQISSTDSSAAGIDVANNMPGFEAGNGGAPSRSEDRNSTRSEAEYVVGGTRSERVIEPGEVRRLSVAILINGTMDGGTYQERPQEELDRLADLARSAAGVDAARGDLVTIASMRFAEGVYDFSGGESWLGGVMADYGPMLLRAATLLGVLALLGVFVLRPVMRYALKDQAAAAVAAVSASPAASVTDPLGSSEAERQKAETVSGSVEKARIRDLAALVDSNPEEALRIMRGWLHQKNVISVSDESLPTQL